MHDAPFPPAVGIEEALRRFEAALAPERVGIETVELGDAVGRVLAQTLTALVDVPPFDCATVEGFAVRAADTAAASGAAPVRLRPIGEIPDAGLSSKRPVARGRALAISPGTPMPRGADAVVIAGHAERDGSDAILVRRPMHAGQNIAFAGSDLARGGVVVRRGRRIGPREVGLLAACGLARVDVCRRPTVAVISTGDEVFAPGGNHPHSGLFDVVGPVIAAAAVDSGCRSLTFPIGPIAAERLAATLAEALERADFVIVSGGTFRRTAAAAVDVIGKMAQPGIVVDAVAVTPGSLVSLAVADGKGIAILNGVPTVAMVTFQSVIAPVLRRLAGQPPRRRATVAATLSASVAAEPGRTDYVLVALDAGGDRPLTAHPLQRNSGSISALAEADGFLAVGPPAASPAAGQKADVALFSAEIRAPDLIVAGSHCVGLDPVAEALAEAGIDVRILSIGSMAGLSAARRGECDIAPIHILHPESGRYNEPFVDGSLVLVKGWRRQQGIVFRRGDKRFEGRSAEAAIDAVVGNPRVLMVNRNAGAGTRFLIEGMLKGRKPEGWANQPRSHNAVAAAVAQGRADWGMAISTVAEAYGLGFLPFAEENYDFAIAKARAGRPEVEAFVAMLASAATGERLAALGLARS